MQCYNLDCLMSKSDNTCIADVRCARCKSSPENVDFNEVFKKNIKAENAVTLFNCEKNVKYSLVKEGKEFWVVNNELVLLKKAIESIVKVKVKDIYEYIDRRLHLCKTTVKNHFKLYSECVEKGNILDYESYTYSQLIEMVKFKNKKNLQKIDMSWSVSKIKEYRKSIESPPKGRIESTDNIVDEYIEGKVTFNAIRSASKKLLERLRYAKQDVSTVVFSLFKELDIPVDGIMPNIIKTDAFVSYEIIYKVGDKVYWKNSKGKFIESEVLTIQIFEDTIFYNINKGETGSQGYKADELYSSVPLTINDLMEVELNEK